MYIYLCNVYIYISYQKLSTTQTVLKSHKSKMSVICMCNHENNVPSRLSREWLCGNSCTWTHGVHDAHHVLKCMSCHKSIVVNTGRVLYIYIHKFSVWCKLIHFSLLLNPEIQRMGNTSNNLHPKCMEQNESHLHFRFYCKLSKVTLDYITELINLNYSFNLP